MKSINIINRGKNLLLGLTLGFAMTSCVDLDQEPLSFYTAEFTPSEQSFTSRANGLYRKFYTGDDANGNYEFNTRVFAMSVGADDVIRGSVKDGTNNRVEFMDELNIQSYSSIENDNKADVAFMWRNMYGAIQTASTFIKDVLLYNIPDAVFESEWNSDTARMAAEFNLATYERLINSGQMAPDSSITLMAEGYFVRALSYFYLVRFFNNIPCYADYSNRTSVNGDAARSEQIPNTPAIDIYEKMIIRDLEFASAILPVTSRSGNSSRPSQWAAKVCLADVYMQMAGWPLKDVGRYAAAAVLCRDIINNSGLSLTPSYADLWKESLKTQSNEHMFAIHHFQAATTAESWNSNYGMSYYASEEGGWADYLMDSAFYESFHADKRKTFIGLNQLASTPPINWKQSIQKAPPIGKYRGYNREGSLSAQSNGLTPIYRYAQVLLMCAEAVNQTEGPNAALPYLQEVQSRSTQDGQPYTSTGLDQAAFDKAVFDEFGWEFAVEAKRWFQLVRKEKVVAQNQFNRRVKSSLDTRSITTEAAAQTGRGYLFPIPTGVIDMAAGVGITINQNPGY